jgi:Uroporphyrinogen decarboxylase (URO-D)
MPVRAKRGMLENAPKWYNTPLDQLDFKWSEEEWREIEGYLRQICLNIAESGEKLTPLERLKASLEGRGRDRLFLESYYFNPYAVRTLDASGETLKPGDVCKDPKLLVKAHMATVARYGLDLPVLYPISYTAEVWGARAAMVDYGNPALVGEYPIKSLADLEGLEVPDPCSTGLHPGYLWACREMKRLFAEYGLDKVMPLSVCIGNDPLGTAGMFMMGWTGFMKAARKNPEICQRSIELATEWTIRMGQAAIDAGADCLVLCSQLGFIPLTGNEWILGDYARIGKALGSQLPCWYALTYEKAFDWFPAMCEQGVVGPGSFRGWFCADMDYRRVIDFSRESDVYCSCALPDKVLLNDPVSVIEDEMRKLCQYGKSYNKFSLGIAAVDYSTPQESFAAAVAAAKMHGRFN